MNRTWRQDGRAWVLEDKTRRWAYVSPWGRRWCVKVFCEHPEHQDHHYVQGLELDEAKAHAESVLAREQP